MSLETFNEAMSVPGSRMRPSERLVLMTLALLANDERFVYESNGAISDRTSLVPTTVSKILTRLETMGYIVRHGASTDRVMYLHPVEYWPEAA